jgi:hypothetical protein
MAVAAVEVKPKETAGGKVPYRHARVLAGRRPRPSQWSEIHSMPVRCCRAYFPALAHVSCNRRRWNPSPLVQSSRRGQFYMLVQEAVSNSMTK